MSPLPRPQTFAEGQRYVYGLLAGGPVGRFKVEASRDGASFEADRA